jgi:hypothetical protein
MVGCSGGESGPWDEEKYTPWWAGGGFFERWGICYYGREGVRRGGLLLCLVVSLLLASLCWRNVLRKTGPEAMECWMRR